MRCPYCGSRIADTLAGKLDACPVCKRALAQARAPGAASSDPAAPPSLAPDDITQDVGEALGKSAAGSAGAVAPAAPVASGDSGAPRKPTGLTAKFDLGQGPTAAAPPARKETPADRVKTPAKPVASSPPPGAVEVRQGLPAKLGHFEIRGKLGEGGMGTVLDGYDPQLDRRVAIKVLSPRLAEDEQFVRRFLAEARSVAKVSHPNVASVFFADSDGNRHFFVMEFIEGESLDDMVEKKGPLTPKAAIGYVMQAVRGLAAAAERGIVHRDVKPANLMVNRQGEVKVMDFGLAKRTGENLKLTQAGSVLGSPHFMAPEQGRGEETDARTDIYSLGATLYFLLTGKPPYEADTAVGVILKHQEAPVPQIDRAPPSLNRLIGKMMAKKPADRYQDYQELLKDLVRLDRSGLLRDEVLRSTGPVPAAGREAVPVAPGQASPPGKRPSDIPTQQADDEAVLLSRLEAAMKNAPDRVKTPVAQRPAAGGVARRGSTALTKLLGRAAAAVTLQETPGQAPAGPEPAAGAEEYPSPPIGKIAFFTGAVLLLLVVVALRPWTWGSGAPERMGPGEDPEVLASIERLRPLLQDPAPETRRHAIVTLARKYAGPTAESLIMRAQTDEDASVRAEAVRLLASMKRPGAVEAIFRSLKDESPDVRVEAVAALVAMTGYAYLSRIDWRTAEPGLRKEIANEFMEWWQGARGSR